MNVGDFRQLFRQRGQLEIVSGEQGEGAHFTGQMPGTGPGQGQTVERARATADLVHQHQARRRRIVEDIGGLGHFHHEGGTPPGQVVGGTDTGEDPVHQADARLRSRYAAADVGE